MFKNMPLQTFAWKGINKFGEIVSGEQNAIHSTLLKVELQRQYITSIKIRKKYSFSFFKNKITTEDICMFSRQITTLLTSGIPFVQSLDLTKRDQPKIRMKHLLSDIANRIESGATIAEALKEYPKQFNNLYCNLIAAGEKSGTIEIQFERITTYQEKLCALKNKIKKTLMYPAVIITVAILVTIGLLVFVIPNFEILFSSFGASLPTPTLAIINLSHFLQSYGWIFIVIIIAITISLCVLQQRSKKFAEIIDRTLLKLPILDNVLKKSAIARLAHTLATLFAAGLPLIDALSLVAKTTGNQIYNQKVWFIREQVINGHSLQSAFQQTNFFPTLVTQMIAIGETSGTLESMLNKIAIIFETEVDQIINQLSCLLEPIIMIILGTLIGSLIIAMYLPIFKLGSLV